jgi:hypothetical protein
MRGEMRATRATCATSVTRATARYRQRCGYWRSRSWRQLTRKGVVTVAAAAAAAAAPGVHTGGAATASVFPAGRSRRGGVP